MHKPFLKAIALTAILSVGALAAAPRAEAHDNDLPAAIAGIALGAIIASQASRHRRHYEYYDRDPYAYDPPPYYHQERRRPRKYAKPAKRHRKQHSTPSYYPSKRQHYNGGRRVAPLPDIPDPDQEGRDP